MSFILSDNTTYVKSLSESGTLYLSQHTQYEYEQGSHDAARIQLTRFRQSAMGFYEVPSSTLMCKNYIPLFVTFSICQSEENI